MYCIDIYISRDCYKVFTDKNGKKSNLWWTHTIAETNNIAKRLLNSFAADVVEQEDFYNCITHENEKHYKFFLNKEEVF